MNVVDDRPGEPNEVPLSSLSVGAALQMVGQPNPIIRTDFINPTGKLGCADLVTGKFAVVDPSTMVVPLNASVHLA